MINALRRTLALSLLSLPLVASADITTSGGKGIDTPGEVITALENIADWMYTIFLVVAVIMIILAAFTYLTSGGGDKVSKAHKMLLYAVVAIVVAVSARGIINLVESIVTS